MWFNFSHEISFWTTYTDYTCLDRSQDACCNCQDENLTTKVVVGRTEIRASPKIPIELWSNCHAVLEGTNDLTNNKSENWNAVSKITLPMKPSIWSVLRSIQVEEQHAKARYYESLGARSEEENSRKGTMDRLAKFKKLRAIVES